MHEGVGQVLAGIQSSSESFANHESDAGVSGVGHVEAQHELVALADLPAESGGESELWEPGESLRLMDTM